MALIFRPRQVPFKSSTDTVRTLASLTTTRAPSTIPFVIRPSAEEIKKQLLDSRKLEAAVRHVHQDGLVVVEDVIPHEHLDFLNTKMVQDARTLQARGKDGPFNYNQGNLQQDPPPVAEFFQPSIFTNSASANAAMPPTSGVTPQRQPVHSDADFAHPSHPFALVVNIPLATMTPENGSTEIWLGTHVFGVDEQEGKHGERASGRIRQDLLEGWKERGRIPSQPTVKKGSVVIRDLRLWHAGMPNWSGDVRIMLAMIHFAPWYRNPMRLVFGEDIKSVLEGLERKGKLGLDVSAVDWVANEKVLGPGGGLSLTALGKLTLSSGSRATSNPLTTSHHLLSLSDVVKGLGVDGLADVLLGLSGGTPLDRTRLTGDLHLGMRNVGDGLAIEGSGVYLLLPGLAGTSGLWLVLVCSNVKQDKKAYLIGSLSSLALGHGSGAAGDGSAVVGDVLLALGNIGDNTAVKLLVGVLLSLGGGTSFDRFRLTSELVLFLGDVGDGLGVEGVVSHFGGF
ncbi:Kanamycin B dioxygenase [Cytospora mali]|uniref:Kanamycin B dioxygenase n=1 Tax=Cytospora mali TaxID=578113 RepID=A0A194URS6_CYTMA|nr:Kanamycin B dioxygenase [Valsa mali var. pyri (nom. inval.)]